MSDIFSNIELKDNETELKEDRDERLQKAINKHNRTKNFLDNIWDSSTHKTVFLIIALVILLGWLISRYILLYKQWLWLKQLNTDCTESFKYFAGAVIGVIVNKWLDSK